MRPNIVLEPSRLPTWATNISTARGSARIVSEQTLRWRHKERDEVYALLFDQLVRS